MGHPDHPLTTITTAESNDSTSPEHALQVVRRDLQNLQREVIAQLQEDVSRLRAEKTQLLNDIDRLYTERDAALSQQQLAQQQLWARHLAQALANHLQVALTQRAQQRVPGQSHAALPGDRSGPNSSENIDQLLLSLDTTLNQTLTALRHDIHSYQSALSQQLNRMHNTEQQGEAILEALVNRLNQKLQVEIAKAREAEQQAIQPSRYSSDPGIITSSPPRSLPPQSKTSAPSRPRSSSSQSPAKPGPRRRSPSSLPIQSTQPQSLSKFQWGLILVLLSTLALSLHNVVVRIVGNESTVLGLFQIGGFIRLNSINNSLLILWLRMLVVVPLMMILGGILYRDVWKDIKAFSLSNDRRLLLSAVGSGFFLFLSQALIYIAFGQFGNPGVPVTILFMYPIITVPLAWKLFGDRLTRLGLGVMGMVLLGVLLTAYPAFTTNTNTSWLGISTAITSGIAFAFYLITMENCFRLQLKAVPVSLIQFSTIFVLSSLSLILLGVNAAPADLFGLMGGGFVLGTLTLIGYLLNNYGVRYLGAAWTSVITAGGPALTTLLAFLLIPGPSTLLKGIQVFGILIVTVGVVSLAFQKMLSQPAKALK